MAVPRRLHEAEDEHAHAMRMPTRTSPRTAVATATSSRRSATPRWSRSRGCRPNPSVSIFAKLEMLNPTGSVKDRVAKYLIDDLEARGLLRDGFDHPRADVREHRHRTGDDRPAQGLPRRAGHARQRHQRAAPDGRAVRGGGHRLPGVAGLATGRSRWPSTSSARTSAS